MLELIDVSKILTRKLNNVSMGPSSKNGMILKEMEFV